MTVTLHMNTCHTIMNLGGAIIIFISVILYGTRINNMAYLRRRNVGDAFRNNHHLQQFVLRDITPTGRILGTGSYGSVEEVSLYLVLTTTLQLA